MDLVVKLHQRRIRINLLSIYIIFISICYILPEVKYRLPYIISAIISLLVYVFYVSSEGYLTKLLCVVLFSSGGLMVMAFLVMYRGDMINAANEFIREIKFLAPGILFLLLIKNNAKNVRSIKRIFGILSMLIFYICVKTMQELIENPFLARALAAGELDEEIEKFRFLNIGGFAFSYAMGFVLLFMFGMMLIEKRQKGKIFFALITLFLFVYIVKTQYALLFWMSLLGCLILAYREANKNTRKVILVLFGVFCAIFMADILVIMQRVTGETLSARLQSLEEFWRGGGVAVLGSRPRVYREAFTRFLHSPIWGTPAYINRVAVAGMQENHSTFLGYLQGMGVIGGICFYTPFRAMMKTIEDELRRNHKAANLYQVICWCFFALSFFNPIQYCFEIGYVIFLYIPCGIYLFVMIKD